MKYPLTKYHFPDNHNNSLIRTRLSDCLSGALTRKFILVSAPAGYGKTTAVVDWLKTMPHKKIWFSVEVDDNRVGLFWKHVLLPFYEFIPELYQLTEDVFLLEDEEIFRMLIPILVKKVRECSLDILFVFDDFHLINQDAIIKGIEFLVKNLPENLKIIFISRQSLPFSIEKYRAAQLFHDLTVEDLQFTREDFQGLIFKLNREFQEQDVDEIILQNEGWITGIQIMLMENQKGKNQIRHFMIDEIIDNLSQEMKMFFWGTSIVNAFCPSLCNALFERSDSYEIIQRIIGNNVFVFSLDDSGVWYRYHHLFLDTLKNQAQALPEDLRINLHKRAAAWYEKNQMFENAIDHFLMADSSDDAIRLIEKVAPVAIKTNDFSRIMPWLKALPEQTILDNYILCLIYAWYYQLDTQFDKTFEKAWHYIHLAEAAYVKMEAKGCQETLLEAARGDILHFKVVYGMLSNHFQIFMEASAEIAQVNTANTVFARNGLEFNRTQPTLIFLLFENLNYFYTDTIIQTIQRLKKQKIKDLSYGYVVNGEMMYEFGNLKMALPILIDGIVGALDEQKYGAYLPGVNTLAKTYWALGDKDKAISTLLDGESILLEHNKVLLAKKMSLFRRWLLMNMGEKDQASFLMEEYFQEEYPKITIQNEFDLSVYARALIEKEFFSQAEILVLRLIEFADRLDQIRWKIVFYNILSRNYFQKKECKKALTVIEKSLMLGMKHKYFRIFVEEGEIMNSLLEMYLREYQGTITEALMSYISSIVAILHEEHDIDHFELTETEGIILGMLRDGLTNRDIAEMQCVQVDTVKKHLTSIYKKLDVKNRTQAILLAEEKGLFKLK